MMNNSNKNFISNKHVNFKNFEESTMAQARYKVSKITIDILILFNCFYYD